MIWSLKKDLVKLRDPAKAAILSGFFKTGKGQYGEGDIFWGITVPKQRKVAEEYVDIDFAELDKILASRIHEHRLVALIILVAKYKKADTGSQKKIVDFYLKNLKYVNNWDLVDLSAPYILGEYLLGRDKSLLYELAKSGNLWGKRVAILSTFAFIKRNEFGDALAIYKILLLDKHDLVHKACGWMLREIGKRDIDVELAFLNKNFRKMPRVMLRYAIERFESSKKEFYLKG